MYCYNGILQYIVLLQWNIAIYCIVIMEYCNILYCCNGIFIAEYQYNQYDNNIIVPSAVPRYQKPPQRFGGDTQHEFKHAAREYFRQKYFEACDILIGELSDHFEQEL